MIANLRNLGPASAKMLAAAGIKTEQGLRQIGAVAAFHAVRQVMPGASLNLLWALEGALADQPWQIVARQERGRLLFELDDLTRLSESARL